MKNEKRCSKCKTIKSIFEFSKCRRSKDGLQSYCKSCIGAYGQTAKGKFVNQRAMKKYRKTDKGKLTQKRYYDTIRGHISCIWHNLLTRCNNKKFKYYKHYGGRGIKVKFDSFEDFYDYVVNELKADPRGLTIDRINNNGHYERGNIRFVTLAENCRNRRPRRKIKLC